jgi:hypothetical protein
VLWLNLAGAIQKIPFMKSLFSRFLQRKSGGPSAQQVRLCLARFRHLLRLYGQLVALCADAGDKQSGQYILDKAYIFALSDRAFQIAKGMVYDLSALTGQPSAGLDELVEVLGSRKSDLLRPGTGLSATGNEEYEYRLLREIREVVCATGNSTVPWLEKPAAPDLLGIAQSIQRDACDFVAGLVAPLSSANDGRDSVFPIRTSFIDLMAGLSGSSQALLRADSHPTDFVPAGEFLKSYFMPTVWSHSLPDSSDFPAPSLVTLELEESMHAITFHRYGYDLFDVLLSCAPEANYFYCRFPSDPASLLKEGVLNRLGFFVRRTEKEITGWIGAQPLMETTAKLKAISKMAALLLQPSAEGANQTDSGVDHFLQTCM